MDEFMSITEETTKKVTVNLTKEDVLSLLKDKYSEEDLEKAEVFMRILGDLDQFDGDLLIEESDGGLIVEFTTVTRTRGSDENRHRQSIRVIE